MGKMHFYRFLIFESQVCRNFISINYSKTFTNVQSSANLSMAEKVALVPLLKRQNEKYEIISYNKI